MDDVFKIILFLFVIWSFLSSAFKKKPEPQKQQPQNRSKSPAQKKKVEYSTKDVLEELFGVKIPNPESEIPEQVNSRRFPDHLEKDWKVGYRNLEKNKALEEKSLNTIDYDNFSSLESNLKVRRIKSSETLETINDQISKRAVEIKSKIKNVSTLRDAVLISEILNKPKALRT